MKTVFWIAFTLIVGYGLWVQEIKPRMEAVQGEGAEQSATASVEDAPEVKKVEAKEASGPTREKKMSAGAIKKAEASALRAARIEAGKLATKVAAAAKKEKYDAAKKADEVARQARDVEIARENTAMDLKKAKIQELRDKITIAHKQMRAKEYEWSSSNIKTSKSEQDKVRKKYNEYAAALKKEMAAIK